jgi:uncharacterized protein involved in outer membrane biogenesis
MKKKLCIGGAVILAVILIAFIVVVLMLDGIVKKGVETFGPQITKVSITLDSVHVGLFTGSAKVKGLVVGNPEGCQTPQAISVGLAEVGVNPFSILSDKIIVRSVHVESPEITFEGGFSGNNLSKILANVNEATKSGTPVSTNAPAAGQSGKKIEVDDFLVTGAKVHARLTDFGGKEINVTLPDIHLTDLGKGSDGLTPADLTKAILKAVTSATIKAVTESAAGAGNSVDKIKKGLGGLFGK